MIDKEHKKVIESLPHGVEVLEYDVVTGWMGQEEKQKSYEVHQGDKLLGRFLYIDLGSTNKNLAVAFARGYQRGYGEGKKQ